MCAELSGRAAQRGISVVEIMVAMVIGLVIGLAATGSAALFSASQKGGIGAGGVAVNSTTALAAIKAEAASAGLGFFGDSKYLCYTLDLSVGGKVKLDAASFSPVRIAADGTNSQLDVIYAGSIDSGANVLLKGSADKSSAMTASWLPVTAGQAVMLTPGAPDATRPCVVRSVTAVTDATDTNPQTLTFGDAGSYNGIDFTTAPSFKADPNKDRITLLGDLRWSRFRLTDGNLVLERPMDGTSATLVRNVLAFRVQYGITTAGGSTLTGWQDATGADFASVANANVERVRALRIGLVTRSVQRDKENKSGDCDATASKPTLFGTAVEPDKTDWKCWRYRTATVIVPLRNLIW